MDIFGDSQKFVLCGKQTFENTGVSTAFVHDHDNQVMGGISMIENKTNVEYIFITTNHRYEFFKEAAEIVQAKFAAEKVTVNDDYDCEGAIVRSIVVKN